MFLLRSLHKALIINLIYRLYKKQEQEQEQEQELYIIHNYKISGDGCYLLECKFPCNELLDNFLEDLNEHANYKLSIVIKK